jgi:predicted lipoprotein with Yx(FWY)xxD motif
MHKVAVLGLALCVAASASYAAEKRFPDQVPVDISIIDLGKDQGFAFQNTYAKPFFTYDLDKPNTSNCNGHCAEIWVPVYPMAQHPTDIGDFTLVNRTDGTQQWAYKGKPLYTFGFGDHEPPTEKDTQGKWHELQP